MARTINLFTTVSGPHGTWRPGIHAGIPEALIDDLLAGGYATLVEVLEDTPATADVVAAAPDLGIVDLAGANAAWTAEPTDDPDDLPDSDKAEEEPVAVVVEEAVVEEAVVEEAVVDEAAAVEEKVEETSGEEKADEGE